MKKFKINGVEFCDFGTNNYSDGMHLVTAYPIENMSQFITEVLQGAYPGIYLNPSADCSGGTEFFGVYGTEEQYKTLYKRQRDAQIASRVIFALGGPEAMLTTGDDRFHQVKAQVTESYKDWWLR
jgi:hypothetical protein